VDSLIADSPGAADSPAARADRLLQDVLGEEQYRRFRAGGFLDLPSRKFPGRTYRLDSSGNLSYREPGETGFNTTLCVQPTEAVPLDDQIVMRYLLVTADEDRLVEVANPITFGFISLTRALYHDFGQRYSSGLSLLLTLAVVAFLLGSLWLEYWAFTTLLASQLVVAVVLIVLFVLPAFVGLILVIAGGVEAFRTVRTWLARGRMRFAGHQARA